MCEFFAQACFIKWRDVSLSVEVGLRNKWRQIFDWRERHGSIVEPVVMETGCTAHVSWL